MAALLYGGQYREGLLKRLPYAAAGCALLLLVVITWHKTSEVGSEQAGFHVRCAAPDCGRVFVIPRDEIQGWQRSPSGEGLKCERCGRFTGKMAVHCDRCDQWFTPGSQDGSGCPRCNPPKPGRRDSGARVPGPRSGR